MTPIVTPTDILDYFPSFRIVTEALKRVLHRKGSSTLVTGRVLLLSVLILYAMTSMHMASLVWNGVSVSRTVTDEIEGLLSSVYDAQKSLEQIEKAVNAQSWMMTAAAGINVSSIPLSGRHTCSLITKCRF